ncbi:hypothetical protein BDW59DRAFT_181208 [Aspergillus cavernicola]|uniref:LCCL domain-containing protein n=1 Tax=Aspergillus cavernicola TaxID=176166 RepID=A0ABR4I3L1_9EURO
MDQFKGLWVSEKALSTGLDPILKIQGLGWAFRKLAAVATIRLDVSINPEDKSNSASPIVIDTLQTATGGLSGTKEKRVVDWSVQEESNYVNGTTLHQSRFVHGSTNEDGKLGPDFELQSKVRDEKVRRFLRGEILEDGSSSTGFVGAGGLGEHENVWVHTWERNVKGGWTMERVWGFEEIQGKRYHTRRVVSTNEKGEYAIARFVYSSVQKD